MRLDGRRAGRHKARGKVGENGHGQTLNGLSFFVKYTDELATYNDVVSCFTLHVLLKF